MQVLLTCDRIKCSLGMLFSIVNYQYGTRGPATIRDRSADHWWSFRWLLRGCGGADSGGPTVVAGIAPHHTVFVRSFLVPKRDRKSTRLNSSHRTISYAVFCLKKKKKTATTQREQ